MNTTCTIEVPGPVAQDKDWARRARLHTLLPALSSRIEVRLDFSKVTIATQSFVHALVSEAIRTHGEAVLSIMEFHRCSAQVELTVKTVVTYSLRARALAATALPRPDSVRSADVPQADDLQKVRRVIDAAGDGPIPVESIAEVSGFSQRHAYYRVNAARTLELLQIVSGFVIIAPSGLALLETAIGSTEERDAFREAIASSHVISLVAPRLLAARTPSVTQIERNIMRLTTMSQSTASRRAHCLLSWRRQLIMSQLSLPAPKPVSAEPERTVQLANAPDGAKRRG